MLLLSPHEMLLLSPHEMLLLYPPFLPDSAFVRVYLICALTRFAKRISAFSVISDDAILLSLAPVRSILPSAVASKKRFPFLFG